MIRRITRSIIREDNAEEGNHGHTDIEITEDCPREQRVSRGINLIDAS
jgi:hypothetical protein